MNDYNLDYQFDDYTTTTTTMSDADTAAFLAFMMAYLFFMLLVIAVVYIYTSITLGKIFKKAGGQAWVGWIPVYNMWKMFEMGKFNGALSLLAFVPFVGGLATMIISIIAAYRIGLGFRKSGEFILLYIFLSPVWLGILAFGKAEWTGDKLA